MRKRRRSDGEHMLRISRMRAASVFAVLALAAAAAAPSEAYAAAETPAVPAASETASVPEPSGENGYTAQPGQQEENVRGAAELSVSLPVPEAQTSAAKWAAGPDALIIRDAGGEISVCGTDGTEKTGTAADAVSVPEKKTEEDCGKQKRDPVSLGRFRITHYCPCAVCCGAGGGKFTASGTVPEAGRTAAADPSVLPLGSRIVIGGHTYTVEDTGSAVNGKTVDIFVNTHSEALQKGTYTAEVYPAD